MLRLLAAGSRTGVAKRYIGRTSVTAASLSCGLSLKRVNGVADVKHFSSAASALSTAPRASGVVRTSLASPTKAVGYESVRAFAAPQNKRGAAANNKEGDPSDVAFTMEGVTKKLDTGRMLFNNINTGFYHGAKIGILGKNGAGKSSLLRIIAGVDKNYEGSAKAAPNKKVGYLAQEPELDETKTVMENVLDGVREQKNILDEYEAVNNAFADEDADINELVDRQAKLQAIIDERNLWDLSRQVEVAMAALRCPPGDANVVNLSGGERRRVALTRLLLSKPDILLLDEPTNHLDAGSVQWLEQYLDQYTGLVVAITHDRYFLDNVAGYILEIENGRFFPFKGNYAAWLDNKAKRQESEAKQMEKLDKVISRELQWMGQRQKGRQAKGKARERQLDEMLKQREEGRKSRVESGSLVIPQGPRLAHQVITVKKLGLAFDPAKGPGGTFTIDELKARPAAVVQQRTATSSTTIDPTAPQWLFRNVSFSVQPGQVVGIVGPNGVGKTTILKLLQGLSAPSAGEITTGQSVVFGYNAQTRVALNPENVVWKEITGGAEYIMLDDRRKINARGYVSQFNFHGTDQSKTIGQLSGGERNRVQLAKSLKNGCNVIMLDEPTNDLDVDTLRSLEEAMNTFEGCAFIVSHDRWFLDRVCTDILGFEEVEDPETGETYMSANMFPGNYTEFMEHVKEKTGKDYVFNEGKRFKNMVNIG